jgi:hypothetical protein
MQITQTHAYIFKITQKITHTHVKTHKYIDINTRIFLQKHT